MNMSQRRGIAAVQTIAIIVALVVIGGVAWYFTSDVFRTRVDATARELTYWTPENIAKDPVMYLNFVETETKEALQSLKANKIEIAQSRAKLDSMKTASSTKVNNGEKVLAELKALYKQAAADQKFPIEWQGKKYDENATKRQIVSINKEVDQQKALLSKVEQGLRQLENQEGKIQEAEAQAQQQLTEVDANRQLLKVQALTDDLQDRLVSMRGALQATVSTVSESSSLLTLDQIQAQSATAVDEEEFEAIMAED